MKKILLVCLTTLFSIATWGYDETMGKVFTYTDDTYGVTLWYHTTSDTTCEVISPTEDKGHDIDGDEGQNLVIPSEVSDGDGNTYTVTRIDDRAFDYTVTYTSNNKQVNGRIYLANACKVTIPATVVSIGASAFANQADMGNVTFSDGTEQLVFENEDGYGTVFAMGGSDGGISTIYIGRDIVLSGDATTSSPFAELYVCLRTVEIGPTVTEIPAYLFYYRYTYTGHGNEGNTMYYGHLTTINFTNATSLKTIGAYAFSSEERMYSAGTSEMTSLTLPSSLESIGEGAFSNMQELTAVSILATTPPTVAANIFGDGENTKYLSVKLSVPEGCLDTYQNSDWGDVYYVVWADATPEEITVTSAQYDDNTYYATYYDSANELTIPEGVTISVIESVDADGVMTEQTVTYEDGNPSNQSPTVPSVEEHYVPAGNAVLLKSSTSSFTATATPANTTPFIDGYTNILYGSDTETETNVNGVTEGYYFYMLSFDSNSENLGFYWGEEGGAPFQSAAHKAWLALDSTFASGLSKLSFKKDDVDTTGISFIETDVEGTNNGTIYTIQGVRVADMTQPGIYIQNGKKVLVK